MAIKPAKEAARTCVRPMTFPTEPSGKQNVAVHSCMLIIKNDSVIWKKRKKKAA